MLDIGSDRQNEFVNDSHAFINVADGAVRSGKTYSALVRFVIHTQVARPGDMMILGKTERTLERNVVSPMREMFGSRVNYLRGVGQLTIGDRLIHVVGANDERSEEKIRGATLAGAYCNELTLYPESAFNQLIARCSVEDARIFGDCNPDSPYHWLYKNFLSRDLDPRRLRRFRFRLQDNPTLPAEYIENLKVLYTGLWYRRMVEGEWVIAEGAVYDMLDVEPGGAHVVKELPEKWERVVVGADYGTSNDTVFLAAGRYRGTWTVFSEERYKSDAGQRTDAEHSAAFREWLAKLGVNPQSIEVDPSAASFKQQLRRDGVSKVRDADHAVLDGIRTVARGLTSGELKIHESCEELLQEMSVYAWDSKAQEKGEDKPLKQADHGPDALRYLAMRALGRPALSVVKKPVGL